MTTRIALITGGSRGLGRNAAEHLAAAGVDVIITYHRQQAIAQQVVQQLEAKGVKADALPLDVGDSSGFDHFVTRLTELLQQRWVRDHFDFLLNNAGIGLTAAFADTTEDQFDTLMNIHLKGPFFLTQKLLPLLADGGRILNVSSGLARFSFKGFAAYGAMKGAIEVLTRYQAEELGARGIAVNVIAPGAIATDFGDGEVRDNEQIKRIVAARTALGRVGEADDIGGVIAALLSDSCRWINGQRIEVSGGMCLS